ncbi:MAG: hypothetical protein ACMXYB_03405 [Candidatus Woesearchaeota archaeon]
MKLSSMMSVKEFRRNCCLPERVRRLATNFEEMRPQGFETLIYDECKRIS